MGNKTKSIVSLSSATLSTQSVSELNSQTATINDTLTAGGIITNSAGMVLDRGTITNDTKLFDLNTLYANESISNSNVFSRAGFICVTLIDNTTSEGAIALYSVGRMFNLNVYNVMLEKNTNNDYNINLHTETGELTISTNNTINYEIKTLNLFEK